MTPEDWLQSLFGPVGPLLMVLLVIGWLVLRPLFNRTRRQRAVMAADARRLGIDYFPPAGSGAGRLIDEGSHRYAGASDGVAWQLETVLLADPKDDGAASAVRSYSRWTSSLAAEPAGYLLLMNLPQGAGRPTVRPGPFDGLIDKVAALAFLLYVRSYFGEARAAGLAFSPAHRCPAGEQMLARHYTVFCDSPERLVRLTDEIRRLLLELQDLRVAVLWDSAGLALSCPVGLRTAADVAHFAAIGVRLVQLAQVGA